MSESDLFLPSAALHWVGTVGYPPATPDGFDHCHDFHEMVLITSGHYVVEVDGQRYEGKPGQGFIYRAGVTHTPRIPDEGCRLYVIQWTNGPDLEEAVTVNDTQAELASICDWMWHRYPAKTLPKRRHLQALLDALLAAVLDADEAPEQGLALEIAHYIRHSSHESFSLQELATFTGKSLRHVNRVFRAHYGMSPMRYRRQTMLQRAVHMLCNSSASLDEICQAVGYSNQQALARATRNTYDRSPSDLRQHGVPSAISEE